jgi:O-antigen/teichoic acid export membrane protein
MRSSPITRQVASGPSEKKQALSPDRVLADPAEEAAGGNRDLFGRGMLYVVIWSMQIVVATAVSPVLTFALGPAEFGSLASAIALYQLLITFSVLGLDQAVQMQRSDDRTGESARGLLAAGIAVATVVTGLAAATAPLWYGHLGFGGDPMLVVVTLLWTAPGAGVLMVLALLQTEDRLRMFAFVSCLSSVGGQLFGIALMLLVSKSAVVYAWGGVASQLLAFAVGVVATRPRMSGLREWAVLRRALELGAPIMVSGLSIFVLNAGDRFILQRLLGSAEVGRYQVAYTIGYVIVLILSFTNRAWTPRMAAIVDISRRWRVVRDSRDAIYRLLIPSLLGVTLAGPALLRLVAPASFRPESLVSVVFLVALAAFPVAAGGATGRMLITLRRSRSLALGAAISVLIKLGLNFALIPWLGIAGAGVATLLAFSVQALVQSRALAALHLGPERPPWRLTIACVGAAAVAGAAVLLPQTSEWIAARFVVAFICLPWFLRRLRLARNTEPESSVPDVAPTLHSAWASPEPTSPPIQH